MAEARAEIAFSHQYRADLLNVKPMPRYDFLPLLTEILGAAMLGHQVKMRLLLSLYPDGVNACDESGDTPLKTACCYNQRDIVIWLLAHGGDVNAQSIQQDDSRHVGWHDGYTALMWSASAEIAGLLLDAGADVNLADGLGRTALMYAVSAKDVERVELLLARGAEVDRVDSWGRTALMIAVESDDLERVALLLAHGADRILFDKDGKTAADRTNNPAIKSLLDARNM